MAAPPSPDASGTPIRVLVIDDNPDDRRLVARELRRHLHVRIVEAGEPGALDAALRDDEHDIAITDYQLRWSTGTEVLRRLKREHPDRPVIMFTASGNEEVAVEAMKEGLDDYITKTAKHYPRIPFAVNACLERARARVLIERTLEAERRATARLQLAFEAARMGTWQFDAHGGRLGYSEQVGPMFGHPRGFVHADVEAWLEDVHPDDRARLRATWLAALEAGTTYEAEFRVVGRDGVLRWLASSGRIFRNGGDRPTTVIGIVRDVSEQRRGEAALREADRRKDEFLAMLSHELRNPLAPIRSSLYVIGRCDLPAHAQPALQMATRQLGHMARLVDDLLEVSRITRGAILVRPERLEVQPALRAAAGDLTPMLGDRGQRVAFDLPADPLWIDADPMRFGQVVENLLTNASKYSEPGSVVTVRAAADGANVRIDVADEGVGIDPADFERVFEPFTQIDVTLDRARGGLGIGLALVRQLVEAHGGGVTVTSAGPGRGATFTVLWPAGPTR